MANITPAMPQLQDDDDEIDAVVVDHGDDRCFRTRGIFLQLQSAVVIIRLLVLLPDLEFTLIKNTVPSSVYFGGTGIFLQLVEICLASFVL